jgi:predicted GIY-YIG superfamily endonuclease
MVLASNRLNSIQKFETSQFLQKNLIHSIMKNYYVYIMLICGTGVLMTGITTHLLSIGLTDRKSKNIRQVQSPNQLLYLEKFNSYQSALNQEKALKKNLCHWDLEVIENSSKQIDLCYA